MFGNCCKLQYDGFLRPSSSKTRFGLWDGIIEWSSTAATDRQHSVHRTMNEERKAYFLTRHSTVGESTASSTNRSAHGQEQRRQSGDREPVGITQSSLNTTIPSMVLYNVPEHHVNHKHHQSDNKAQGGTEGHENGGNSGSGTGTEQAENKGEKGKEAGNRVENHGISEIVQDCLIDVDVAVKSDSVNMWSICFERRRETERT